MDSLRTPDVERGTSKKMRVKTQDSLAKNADYNLSVTAAKQLSEDVSVVFGLEVIATKMSKITARKTGGGEPEEKLTNAESHMLHLIGKKSVLGIDEGLDLSLVKSRKRNLSEVSVQNMNTSLDCSSSRSRSTSPFNDVQDNEYLAYLDTVTSPQPQKKRHHKKLDSSGASGSTSGSSTPTNLEKSKSKLGQKAKSASVEQELLNVQKDVLLSMSNIEDNIFKQRKESRIMGENVCNFIERIAKAGESAASSLSRLTELKELQLKFQEEKLALLKNKLSGESYEILLTTPNNSQD